MFIGGKKIKLLINYIIFDMSYQFIITLDRGVNDSSQLDWLSPDIGVTQTVHTFDSLLFYHRKCENQLKNVGQLSQVGGHFKGRG